MAPRVGRTGGAKAGGTKVAGVAVVGAALAAATGRPSRRPLVQTQLPMPPPARAAVRVCEPGLVTFGGGTMVGEEVVVREIRAV